MRISDWSSDVCSSDLRGPQGTLFGRNTPGGALNILTRDPTKDFEVIAHGEVGNYAYRNAGIVLNTPITDDLSARVVYNFKEHDGYARNEALGQEANDQKSHFVRGKLKYRTEERRGGKEWVSKCRSRWWA